MIIIVCIEKIVIESSYKSSFLDLTPKTQKERRKKKMIADMLMNKVIDMFSGQKYFEM